jgi:uncharacterized membrane protein HdeD (DUF308 family)
MFLILCAFIIVSFFELVHLFKTKEKKEAVIYIVLSVLTVIFALFLMLTPDYSSFSKIFLGLAGIKQ